MKKAAKVFIIIGMVVQCFLIYPIILGIFALMKLDSAQTKSDLTVWAIVTLLCVNTIAGILMLCIPESDFAPAVEEAPVTIEVDPE